MTTAFPPARRHRSPKPARCFHGRCDPTERAEILKEMAAIRRGEKPFTAAQVATLQVLAELSGIAASTEG